LLGRSRGRGGHPVVLAPDGDVERCRPGAVLERQDDGHYVVSGEVVAIEADRVVLDVDGREVTVLLEGHRNPATPWATSSRRVSSDTWWADVDVGGHWSA
jgi:hypothetical protein